MRRLVVGLDAAFADERPGDFVAGVFVDFDVDFVAGFDDDFDVDFLAVVLGADVEEDAVAMYGCTRHGRTQTLSAAVRPRARAATAPR